MMYSREENTIKKNGLIDAIKDIDPNQKQSSLERMSITELVILKVQLELDKFKIDLENQKKRNP